MTSCPGVVIFIPSAEVVVLTLLIPKFCISAGCAPVCGVKTSENFMGSYNDPSDAFSVFGSPSRIRWIWNSFIFEKTTISDGLFITFTNCVVLNEYGFVNVKPPLNVVNIPGVRAASMSPCLASMAYLSMNGLFCGVLMVAAAVPP
jgi:hypothetical protein